MRAPPYSADEAELFGTATIEDPHPLFARVRARHPIARVGDSRVHLVSTWTLIEEVLGREADFSAHLTGVLVRDEGGRAQVFEFGDDSANQVIATADEPRHAAHRAVAQPRLAAAQAAAMEPLLRRWAREAVTPWLLAGAGEFVPLAETVPARAVAHVLGLPDGDVQRHRAWAMMGGDMLAGDVSAEQMAHYGRETGQLVAYLQEHLDRALESPDLGAGAPLLHALAGGVRAGTIDRREALGISVVMFGAGGESTSGLIGSAVRLLASDPGLANELRNHPSKISAFVEEVVRLEPPFKFHYRSVRRTCELGGARLVPGDRLMLVWAAANRDPAVFDDPDALRLDRRHPKQHLGFGRGGHFCIGAPLARLEARVVLEDLLEATTRLALAPGAAPRHARSIFVRRLESLVLEASPQARSVQIT